MRFSVSPALLAASASASARLDAAERARACNVQAGILSSMAELVHDGPCTLKHNTEGHSTGRL